jgi:hypothetical protein
MTVSYIEYSQQKQRFLGTIGEWNVYTSPMDEYGRYYKQYVGPKGTWYEAMEPVEEEVEAEVVVHGIAVKIRQTVKFLRTEFWSTKDSRSKFYYEKW